MLGTLETKACHACSKAKRKCSKKTPECLRCKKRGIRCTYPPNKPSCFVLLESDDFGPLVSTCSPCSTAYPSSCTSENFHIPQWLPFEPSAVPPVDAYLSFAWFNLPATWNNQAWPQRAFDSFQASKVKWLVSRIQDWLKEWISTGSNPFIHPQLYHYHLPQSIQDAYTTLSAYLHRKPENEHFVFEILKARIAQLRTDDDAAFDPQIKSSINYEALDHTRLPSSPDTLDHLARVQALTTYLLLMLFDGDIRLRYVAEQHSPLLEVWLEQMVESARNTKLISSGCRVDTLDSEVIWHAWIMAESLRRTLLVGRTVVVLYEMLKAGKTVPAVCKGAMAVTIRKGAWEAKSASEWQNMAAEMYLGLMQVEDAWRWVRGGGISRGQVDDLADTFLKATFEDP